MNVAYQSLLRLASPAIVSMLVLLLLITSVVIACPISIPMTGLRAGNAMALNAEIDVLMPAKEPGPVPTEYMSIVSGDT